MADMTTFKYALKELYAKKKKKKPKSMAFLRAMKPNK